MGLAATSLAVLLGARNVVLLGFDMKLGVNGETHWHQPSVYTNMPGKKTHPYFIEGFKILAGQMKNHYPKVGIWNATKGSAIEA